MDREVERALVESGVRYTAGRRQVMAALAAADGPRSAAELHDELDRAVPLSSIYRTYSVLEAAGVIEPHHGTKGLTRYEPAEWLMGHHHHLVCIDCGSVDDVEIPEPQERDVRELVAEIGSAASFRVLDHVLEIEGQCARCA